MKKNNGFSLIWVIVIIVLTAFVTSIATGVIMLNNSSAKIYTSKINLNKDKELQEFIELYQTLVSKYYDDVDKEGMLNAAEEAMTSFLGDKYTTYLDDREYKQIIDELSGTYNGIGITINGNTVNSVLPDSPAERAGIMVNDVLISINGNSIADLSGSEISELIKSINTSNIDIEIDRNGEILSFNLEKQDLIYPNIKSEIIEGTTIGYIYIENFSQNLGSQISNLLKNLEDNQITSLILDLRDDAGGYLSSAEDVASLFIENGKPIYSLESNNSKYTYNDMTKEKRDYPIVVLINGGSASAAEILAAALKESYGAQIVGTKSYGKGKVQQVLTLNNGNSVKYTSAIWLTPEGTCIDGIGIYPDYNIQYEKSDKYDSQITKAIEILQE